MEEQIRRLVEFSHYSNTILQQISQRQASAPKGKLQVTRKNGRTNYYHYFDDKTPLKYLNKSQMPLIETLAQKKYDQQACKAIVGKKTAVDQCIEILRKAEKKYSLSKIYENFPVELKPLIKPLSTLDEDYAKKWQARKYLKSTLEVEAIFKTKRGEFVRSKSELIIANKLYDANIPYHYETLIIVNNEVVGSPDFLVLNPRTRKEYYWEHFGKMSDPTYLIKTLKKFEKYARAGVILGLNLIATFECENFSINTLYIDRIIERLFK